MAKSAAITYIKNGMLVICCINSFNCIGLKVGLTLNVLK